jgi:hypothetical protein
MKYELCKLRDEVRVPATLYRISQRPISALRPELDIQRTCKLREEFYNVPGDFCSSFYHAVASNPPSDRDPKQRRSIGAKQRMINLSAVPPKCNILLSERNPRKVNQPVFSLWIVVTIIPRNSFESLHLVPKHVLQSWPRDGPDDFVNCCM